MPILFLGTRFLLRKIWPACSNIIIIICSMLHTSPTYTELPWPLSPLTKYYITISLLNVWDGQLQIYPLALLATPQCLWLKIRWKYLGCFLSILNPPNKLHNEYICTYMYYCLEEAKYFWNFSWWWGPDGQAGNEFWNCIEAPSHHEFVTTEYWEEITKKLGLFIIQKFYDRCKYL